MFKFKSDNELSWEELYAFKKDISGDIKVKSRPELKTHGQPNFVWFELIFRDGHKSLRFVENTEKRKDELKKMQRGIYND